ncbi:magnesium and cobalt transport protein CorA [Nakamurella endophytica]|uniref:Magnesium transport protein CorA n=1 Tax=Nakamurella endophytica TaxID=1748367 RepID=A0A917SRR0_9ACTN|nr:magnesium and cobalt transport protein CorA [Nakamurella endophytica]GGL95761.1 magnesium transport protein CorA [Nakamurella endophytica]
MPVLPTFRTNGRKLAEAVHGRPRPDHSDGATRPVGAATPPTSMVNCAAYVDGDRQPGCTDPRAALDTVRDAGRGFVWVGFHEPTEAEMSLVAETFGLHPLAVEDAAQAYQRPKLERYGAYFFLVLKTVKFVDHAGHGTAHIVSTGEIMLFVGRDFLVTVRHGEHSGLAGLRQVMEHEPEHLALGPAAVMHAIADRVVDEYLSVVSEVEEDIDEMETAVFSPKGGKDVVDTEDIYLLKREILGLKRAVAPLAAPLKLLSGAPSPLVPDEVREYMRDVEDHLSTVAERIASFDEMLTTLVSAALAEISTRQNEDMRKISAWAAIALVPTAIAGIYGMNFEHMPELTWRFGYPMALVGIALICTLLYVLLRRRGWL